MLSVSESYIIGIDISTNDDEACITVAKQNGSRLTLINVIQGEEVTEIYNKLTKNKLERSSKNE